MANGIDDEPSGAQAYFTTAPPRDQQQSRPEDEPVAGNDREGHQQSNENQQQAQLENQMRDLNIEQDLQPAAVPIVHAVEQQPHEQEPEQHQQDYTYNDLHSDTALHGHNVHQPVNLPVSAPVPINNPGIDMGLHSEAIGQGIPEMNPPPPANQSSSLPANQEMAGNHSQNPLPPMENPYIQINHSNQFQPVSNPMSQLKGNEDEDIDENQRRTRAHTDQRLSESESNPRTETRPATRPPLDAPRAPLRDPAANAPITPHEADPTPANRISTNPVSNLESMSNRPHTISNRSIPNSNQSAVEQDQEGYQHTAPPQLSQPQLQQPQLQQPQMSQPQMSQPQLSQPPMSQPPMSQPQMSQAQQMVPSQSQQYFSQQNSQNPQQQNIQPPQQMQPNQQHLHQQPVQQAYQQQQMQPPPTPQQVQQPQQLQQQQSIQQNQMGQQQMGGYDPHTGQPYLSGHMPPPPQVHQGYGHPAPNYGHPTSHPPPVSHPYMAQNPYMNNSFHSHGPGSIPGDVPERPMSRPGSVGPAPSIHSRPGSVAGFATGPQGGPHGPYPPGPHGYGGYPGYPPPFGMYGPQYNHMMNGMGGYGGYNDPFLPPHLSKLKSKRMPPWAMDPRYMHHSRAGSVYDDEDDRHERTSIRSDRSIGRGKRSRKENIYKELYNNYPVYPDDDPSEIDGYGGQFESTSLENDGRKTPPKYSMPHCIARFSPTGHLVKIPGSRPDCGQSMLMELHSLEAATRQSEMTRSLHSFPGPLSKSDTHKGDVLRYCSTKADEALCDMNNPDFSSYNLLWNLLCLLVRSNGSSEGHEYAELLLGGSFEQRQAQNEEQDIDVNVTSDRSIINDQSQTEVKNPQTGRGYTEIEKVGRFRELIQYGRQKDALEWAMKTSLWGHALMLSYKMDSTRHQQVMSRFCTSMDGADPLQTAYQFLSGRQPAAVTQIQDSDIKSWRAHLSMILSNSTQNSNMTKLVYQRSINSLADTLWNKGLLYASQFCYLLGNGLKSFGYFNRKSSKIVLIGGDHTLNFEDFLQLQALQMTEIYEYAMSLSKTTSLPSFQSLKFIYATWLLDHGLTQQAFAYFERIATEVIKAPQNYHPTLVLKLSDLAFRVQLIGQQRSNFVDQAVSPDWLIHLNNVAEQVMGSGIIPENPILNSDRRDSRASQRSGSQPPTQLPTQPVSQMYQPSVQNTVPPLQLHKLDSEPSRHQIAFSPDLGSATESDLNTDRSEPELRQTSALSSVTEDEPKPTEPWQNNSEYNQVPQNGYDHGSYGGYQDSMAANQGSYNDIPFNPAPVMDVPSFTPSSSNHNQMPQSQPTHFQPAQPQEQHVQNNVHNVEPVAQNNQYSNPQVRSRHNTDRSEHSERPDSRHQSNEQVPTVPMFNPAGPMGSTSTSSTIPPPLMHPPSQMAPPSSMAPPNSMASTSVPSIPMMQPTGGYESKSVSPPVMPSGPSQPPPPSTITPPVLQAPPSMPNLTPVSMATPPSMPSMLTMPSMPPMSMAPPSMNSQSSSQPPSMPPSMNSSKRPSGDAGQMNKGFGAAPITSAPMMSEPPQSGGESKPLQDNNSKKTGNTSMNQSQSSEKKSGFFQKFAASVLPRSLTGEVYLPDDKDKSLYYDEQLGRWVDKNAPDEGENKPPPPPMIPKSTGGSDGLSGGGPMSAAGGPMGMNGAPGGQGGFRRGGQRKRNMYKDAGVMGEKIRSNISNNPMMTSPSFGSSIPSASMFQPTFQPGSENGNTQPETQTQGDPSQYQPAPASPTTEAANSQSGAPQFFNPTQFGANPPAMPTS